MDEPALLCRYVGMGRWDWIMVGLCSAWLLALVFIAGPELAEDERLDWGVVAAFSQAVMSAAAIFAAFALDRRRRDQRKTDDAETLSNVVVALSYAIQQVVLFLQKRASKGTLTHGVYEANAHLVRDDAKALHALDLTKLTDPVAILAVIEFTVEARQFANRLDTVGGSLKGLEAAGARSLAPYVDRVLAARSKLLGSLGHVVEPDPEIDTD